MRLLTSALLLFAVLATPAVASHRPTPNEIRVLAFEESSYSAHSLGSERFTVVRYTPGRNPRFFWALTEFRDIGCKMRLHMHLRHDGWMLWDERFVAGCDEYNT